MSFALWWLWVGHFICDYPLQGDFLARGKNHTKPLEGIPWFWCLFAHGMIHAGWVYAVTSSLTLSVAELVVHMTLDWLKSNGNIDFNADQWLHMLSKVIWVICLE